MATRTKPARYRNIASIYDLLFGSVNRPLSRVGVTLSQARAGMRVLDVCCGTGTHLEAFQGRQCVLFGLDASPAMLRVAQGRLRETAHLDRGDGTRLPYARGAFDVVGCKLALHEMPAEARASVLEEARRVLKPGGRLVLIDFHPGPYEQLRGWIIRLVIVGVEFIAGREHYKNHRQFLASGGLVALGQGQGLQVETQVLLSGGNFAVQCCVNGAEDKARSPRTEDR
jgi:demethylmenaquinone methyltransferase/2-methoxy-6-polyprenyl-1,4-benzoquinol methylase